MLHLSENIMNKETKLSGCSFGILGDSYSTFQNHIPEGYSCYYPNEKVDDVLQVEHTWWHQLIQRHGMKLLVNDSYSGATVCTDTREGQPPFSSFTQRVKHAFSGDVELDYIFLFGCTNDSWLERTIGQPKYAEWTEAELRQVLPAYSFVLDYLTRHNPRSKIVAVINTQLHPDIHAGMLAAAEHYGATAVVLERIDKQCGHPSAKGMSQIAGQIEAVLL